MNVVLRQCPWGTAPTQGAPRADRPKRRGILVSNPLSSMKTSLDGSRSVIPSRHSARACDILACLLSGDDSLFSCVIPCRARSRETLATKLLTRSPASRATISQRKRSGVSSSQARIFGACASSASGRRSPPIGSEQARPSRRHVAAQRTAVDRAMRILRPAAPADMPSSSAATKR